MKSSIHVRYNVYGSKAERNRATLTVYPLGSQFKLPRGTSSMEQMHLPGHMNTKQRCEIQWEVLEFSKVHKWLCDSLKPNRRTRCVQRKSQKAFQSTHFHYLPWIYCNVSNPHCTMVYCGRNVGYSHYYDMNFITGVIVYNYSKYVWLSYSMCVFIQFLDCFSYK